MENLVDEIKNKYKEMDIRDFGREISNKEAYIMSQTMKISSAIFVLFVGIIVSPIFILLLTIVVPFYVLYTLLVEYPIGTYKGIYLGHIPQKISNAIREFIYRIFKFYFEKT